MKVYELLRVMYHSDHVKVIPSRYSDFTDEYEGNVEDVLDIIEDEPLASCTDVELVITNNRGGITIIYNMELPYHD